MAKKTITLGTINEGKTAVIIVTIRNENHDPILGSALLTLILTLYDQDTQTETPIDDVINGRTEQDILGVTVPTPIRVNGGLIDETGVLNLRLDPLDNPIIDPTKDVENHIMLLEWSWLDDGATKYGGQEFILPVANLNKIAP
jgi:hypothetical protein